MKISVTYYIGQNSWLCPLQAICLTYIPGGLAGHVFSYFLIHIHTHGHVQARINMYTYVYIQTHMCILLAHVAASFLTALCRDTEMLPSGEFGSFHT